MLLQKGLVCRVLIMSALNRQKIAGLIPVETVT